MDLFSEEHIGSGCQELLLKLKHAADSQTLTFDQICKVDKQGLYMIFNKEGMLYIGKTNRTGKVRMRELAADFRSHTFNRKLLAKRFRDLGIIVEVLKRETKKEMIRNGILTNDDFKSHQAEVNKYIKGSLSFKFFCVEDERQLIRLEHYAIGVLSPIYND